MIEHDVLIEWPEQLAQLEGVTRIEGSLELTGQLRGQLELPTLVSVRDELRVHSALLGAVRLPALVRVGSLMVESNRELTAFETPLLATIQAALAEQEAALVCSGNTQLASAAFPSLRSVTGVVALDGLTTASFPALVQVVALEAWNARELQVPSLARLKTLRLRLHATMIFPALHEVEEVSIEGDLAQLSLPRLERIVARLDLDNTTGRLELPALREAGELSINGNVALPALTQVGRLRGVTECASPTSCALSLPSLETAAELYISGEKVVSVDLSQLRRISWLELQGSSLRFLSLPELVDARWLLLVSNRALQAVAAPKLAALGWMLAHTNGQPICSLSATFPSLLAPEATIFTPSRRTSLTPNECP